MTIRGYDLEQAIVLRDRLKELDIFLEGLGNWGGHVEVSFGSYKASVTAEGARGADLKRILGEERKIILAALVDLDVAV